MIRLQYGRVDHSTFNLITFGKLLLQHGHVNLIARNPVDSLSVQTLKSTQHYCQVGLLVMYIQMLKHFDRILINYIVHS